MLVQFQEELNNMKIILGSSSPRRKELLSPIFKFEIVPSQFDESTINPSMFPNPKEFVSRITDADMIITADTIVYFDGQILGKPHTHERAYEMIKMLNGKSHIVETGVYITMPKKNKSVLFSTETHVYFDQLSDAIIRAYAETDDPLDKAGAYGIQSGAISLISKIDGDYANVVGLPVHDLCSAIYKLLSE